MGNASRKSLDLFVGSRWIPARNRGKKTVVITGCDSGLGFSLSLKCKELGLRVVSGCLDPESEGAEFLRGKSLPVYDLDVTDWKSVREFAEKVKNLTETEGIELHAVVNNAGTMIFGEFEWYTERQIERQVETNLTGSLRTAKSFLPLLRKSKGRLINVTSHCALSNLPSLTVYGATKAALQSWSEGLRLEQKKYGVKVITFIPGSFASQSNIMASQASHSREMEKSFSAEEKKFYGNYFNDFNSYLSQISSGERKPLKPLVNDRLYELFAEALLLENPKIAYKHEPWRYFFYYNSFRIAPTRLKDHLVDQFLKFPRFKPNPN